MKSIDVSGSSFSTDTENLTKSTLLKIIAQGIIDHRDDLAKIRFLTFLIHFSIKHYSAAEPEKKKKKRKKK